MNPIRSKLASFVIVLCSALSSYASDYGPAEYHVIQERLARGWSTWNTRSVLSHVLLPQGFAINLAFKQHYWLDEKYLREALIGRSGDSVEKVRPEFHAYDGSYTRLELEWEEREWKRKGFVGENYSSITGAGDDSRLSSDNFHSWGALFGIIAFIEKGYLPAPELALDARR